MREKMLKYVAKHLISLVPQWYTAAFGEHPNVLQINNYSQTFFSGRSLTPNLRKLLDKMNLTIDVLIPNPLLEQPSFVQVLQEHFAIEWLKILEGTINWPHVIDYLNMVSGRTYENSQVSLNLVISPGDATEYISGDGWQKIVDQLASSPFTYITVNRRMKFVSYNEVDWDEVGEPDSYRFYPSFLHPINSVLNEGEFSAHVTSNGDIIIMDHVGMIASKRKGQWKLYDMATFKNCIASYVKDYWMGAHLFELSMDLSFRRHGALLIFDPAQRLLEHVVNQESFVDTTAEKSGQRLIASAVRNINLTEQGGLKNNRRILAEIASVDGAVIFDGKGVVAFGAVIKPHESVGSETGARTTAAKSAYAHGAIPLKISSDGQATVYFQSSDDDNECEATLEFL